jgi:sugar fermentation stimulation protein A
VGEWLPGGLFSRDAKIYTERRFGNSRFDFYIEDGTRTAYLEVKGVTLEEDGVVSFPDAPTERGVRHLRELESCLKQGHEAYAVFVIQMDRARVFMPNGSTHREFEEALCHAQAAGVKVLAYSCRVAPDSMSIADPVKVRLKGE